MQGETGCSLLDTSERAKGPFGLELSRETGL